MQRFFISTGSLSCFFCVALGAFGAHALKTRLQPEQLVIFETAVRYQFFHSLAILFTVLVAGRIPVQQARISAILFFAGILFFSGSLYVMTASYLCAEAPLLWLGAITPAGGLFFLAGWFTLFLFSLKIKSPQL